jgi:iron complex outermembrane receptor protein/vitamin B12 transporter
MKKVVIVSALLSLCPYGADAGKQELEEFVITGTLARGDSLSEQAIAKWRMDAEAIQLQNPVTVVDILRQAPGVVVTQQGGAGGLSYVSIRGGDPNFSKVLLDGVVVDNPTNSRGGGFDFASLDPLLVEDVQVYYGAYSSLYGSNGLSGLVSIETRPVPEKSRAVLRLERGTDGQHSEMVSASGRVGSVGAMISLSDRKAPDYGSASRLERQQFNFKLDYDGLERADIAIGGFYADANARAFPEDSGGERLAVIREPEQRDLTQSNIYGRAEIDLTERWRTRLLAANTVHEEISRNPGIAPGVLDGVPPLASDTEYKTTQLEWSNTVSLVEDSTVLGLGASLFREDADNESVVDFGVPIDAGFNLERDTRSLYAEVQTGVGSLDILAGHRWDDADDISERSLRTVISYPLAHGTRLTYTQAEGFKLPSIFALMHPLVGNAELQPEKSLTRELRWDQVIAQGETRFSLSLYRNEYEDLVDFDPELFTNVNRSNVVVEGLQGHFVTRLDETLELRLNLGYQDPEVGEEGVKLRRRPDWQGGATMIWRPLKELTGRLSHQRQSAFFDSSIPTGMIELGGIERTDLSVEWQWTKSSTLGLAVDNVFDEGFEEAVGFTNPGRQVRLMLTTQL